MDHRSELDGRWRDGDVMRKDYSEIPIRTLTKISENRYIEEFSMYYEDLCPGLTFLHRPGRTITESDSVWLTLLHMNPHPLHFERKYAETTEFGKEVVSALVTLPLLMGMTIGATSANCVANLGWKSIDLTAPVFVGDTIFAETTVLNRRMSNSRSGQGIVSVRVKGVNSADKTFMRLERSFLIPTRASMNTKF